VSSRAINVPLGSNRSLLVASIVAAVVILFFPARQFAIQRHRIADLRTNIAELRKENAQLSERSKHLSDASELELLARQRLGLVRPGERAYFIEETAPPKKVAASVEHRTNPFGRAWHWLTAIIRGRN
jgi:cell division protein FtsB